MVCVQATPRHGPVRPMAHVEQPSREQNLMHATRVGCSSPDGSPSFRLPISHQATGDLTSRSRTNTGRSLKQAGGRIGRRWGGVSGANVSPSTRNMPRVIRPYSACIALSCLVSDSVQRLNRPSADGCFEGEKGGSPSITHVSGKGRAGEGFARCLSAVVLQRCKQLVKGRTCATSQFHHSLMAPSWGAGRMAGYAGVR